ncbi:MAG: carbohydrate binding domain-containing protein [Clostridia bacterium]|nr:carbohydrate binding domain-containing protein [Clostridia bacterium]
MKKNLIKWLLLSVCVGILCAVIPMTVQADTGAVPAVATAPELINGDFETGDLSGWDAWQGTGVSGDAAKTGDYGAHLTGNGGWGGMLRQDIPVEKGVTYVVSFWFKVNKVGANVLFLGASTQTQYAPSEQNVDTWLTSTSWKQATFVVTPTDDTKMAINFSGGGTGSAESLYVDSVTIHVQGQQPEIPDEPAEPLSLLSFGVLNNRPVSNAKNQVANGSFEYSTAGQWKNDTFLSDTVYVVDDSTTPDGTKSLFFNTSGKREPEWHVFWVDIQPNTNYTFSAWLKGAFLSEDSVGRATVGVIDPDTNKFLTMTKQDQDIPGSMFSTDERQLVPTAWDDRWHLRSVTFYSAGKTQIGIALYGYGTELWVDGLALYEVGDGVKYTSKSMTGVISPSFEEEKLVCAPADSLTENVAMEDTTSTFWQSGNGWHNGFMSFVDSAYEYGRSLKYTGSENAYGLHYIKWLDVKPGTRYTISLDVKILKDGAGKLALIDGKVRDKTDFIEIPFSIEDFGAEWFSLCFSFDTDAFDRIGIAVVDEGGSALLDNIRLFETAYGTPGEDEFKGKADGWHKEDAKWTYYKGGKRVVAKWIKDGGAWYYLDQNGYMVANKWVKDSSGWCYLTDSGKMATNAWIKDSVGWCYVGQDGYCVTNTWKKDSKGWCYLDASGRMATNKWVKDSVGWCYVGANGYAVTNTWKKDSHGWCYLNGSGSMTKNAWVKTDGKWYFLDQNGYMVSNKWLKDSKGWVYVGSDGAMVTNKWLKDSVGWCYVGDNGYCLTSQWKKDSKGWCYLDKNGRMVYDKWVDGFYVNKNGYWVP